MSRPCCLVIDTPKLEDTLCKRDWRVQGMPIHYAHRAIQFPDSEYCKDCLSAYLHVLGVSGFTKIVSEEAKLREMLEKARKRDRKKDYK